MTLSVLRKTAVALLGLGAWSTDGGFTRQRWVSFISIRRLRRLPISSLRSSIG